MVQNAFKMLSAGKNILLCVVEVTTIFCMAQNGSLNYYLANISIIFLLVYLLGMGISTFSNIGYLDTFSRRFNWYYHIHSMIPYARHMGGCLCKLLPEWEILLLC